MHVGHDQWCLVDVFMPHVIYAFLIWCCSPLNDFAKLMRTGHQLCRQLDAHTPRFMCAAYRCMSLVDVAFSIRVGHNWCRLTDTLRPGMNSPDRCAHNTPDNEWSMCTSHDWCRQSTSNIDEAICTSNDIWARSMINVSWPMTHYVGRYFLPKAHSPWWWFLSHDSDVLLPMLTSHGSCMQPMANAACRWPMSLARWQYAMSNA